MASSTRLGPLALVVKGAHRRSRDCWTGKLEACHLVRTRTRSVLSGPPPLSRLAPMSSSRLAIISAFRLHFQDERASSLDGREALVVYRRAPRQSASSRALSVCSSSRRSMMASTSPFAAAAATSRT